MVIYDNLDFELSEFCAVSIGKFDGLHKGHRIIIDELIKQKKNGYQTAVLTFEPGPEQFFGSMQEEGNLIPEWEKEKILSEQGVDFLVRIPFDEKIAFMPAKDFLENILLKKMKAKVIVAGTDVSFGYQRQGKRDFLEKMRPLFHYELIICEKRYFENAEISSSRIRECLKQGRIDKANEMLGTPFHMEGSVETGRKLGHTLGFPTCNISVSKELILLPFGVYYTKVITEDGSYFAMTNIGVRPTVSESGRISVESYLLNFSGDLYGKHIYVEILSFARPEIKFTSHDELISQLKSDEERTKEYFGIY